MSASRPMPTLGIFPDSGGNVPVTCRSAENCVEGQLADQVNSHYRPLGAIRHEHAQWRLSKVDQPFAIGLNIFAAMQR